jgi:site-specific DNA-adenine methylase
MARPFLKWAGGKRQLLKEIDRLLPEGIRTGRIGYFPENDKPEAFYRIRYYVLRRDRGCVMCSSSP